MFEGSAMLDIETFGNSSEAAIVSVAALQFDPRSPVLLEPPLLEPVSFCQPSFYRKVSLQSSLDMGLRMDASTVMWWLQQDKAAQDELTAGPFLHIERMLDMLGAWCFDNHIGYVWSHGASFDVVILANAFQRRGQRTPWKYSNVRDTRTVYDMAGIVLHEEPNPEGYLQHHPLWDCWKQAWALQKAYQKLGLSSTDKIAEVQVEVPNECP